MTNPVELITTLRSKCSGKLNLQTAATVGNLMASGLAIAWTLSRWGFTNALSETALYGLILASFLLGIAALAVLGWLVSKANLIKIVAGAAALTMLLTACAWAVDSVFANLQMVQAVEMLNRVAGVTVGFLVCLTLQSAWRHWS